MVTAAAESEIAHAQARASELGEELALATSRVEKRERVHEEEVNAAVAHARRTMETVAAAAAADLEVANAKNAELRSRLAEKEAQERTLRERLAEASAASMSANTVSMSATNMSANTSTAFSDAASDFKTVGSEYGSAVGSEYQSASQSVRAPSEINTPTDTPRGGDGGVDESAESDAPSMISPVGGDGGTPFMTPGAQFLNTPGGSAYPSAKSTPVQSARGGPGGIPVPPKFESPSRADLRAKMTQAEARAEATERALAGERAELEKVRKEISIMRVEQGAWEKAASPVASPAKPTAAERDTAGQGGDAGGAEGVGASRVGVWSQRG